jgi:hypothetical protein
MPPTVVLGPSEKRPLKMLHVSERYVVNNGDIFTDHTTGDGIILIRIPDGISDDDDGTLACVHDHRPRCGWT